MHYCIQLDLGLGMSPFSGPGLGLVSPGSPGKNNSTLGSAGFPNVHSMSHFSGQVKPRLNSTLRRKSTFNFFFSLYLATLHLLMPLVRILAAVVA